MATETDIRTVTIDGQRKRVEVLGPALKERLLEDTSVNDDPGVVFEELGDNRVEIRLEHEGFWAEHEIQSLDQSDDWDIVDISSNEYAPIVVVEYVGE